MGFRPPCAGKMAARELGEGNVTSAGQPAERRRLRRPFTGRKLVHMQRVLVVDATGKPLLPCRPARARLLCKQGKAVVRLRYPYTIMLQEARPEAVVEPLRLKLDPRARTTGLALVNDGRGEVVWAAELAHRGELVKQHLDQRRRSRRQRKTRYRKPRWHNRRRTPGWLSPSLLSRIANILTW